MSTAISYVRSSPTRASVLCTVAEYLHRINHQPLFSSSHNRLVFEQGYIVSLYLRQNSSAVAASFGCFASEHDDVKSVRTAKTLVASLFPLAEGTMSLYEGPIGLVYSFLLASFSLPGPNTACIKYS